MGALRIPVPRWIPRRIRIQDLWISLLRIRILRQDFYPMDICQILPKCVQRANLKMLNLICQRVLKPKKSENKTSAWAEKKKKKKNFFGEKKKKKKKKKKKS